MSQFRIEQRRALAALTLTTETTVQGCFFLSGSHAIHPGPERVADLLNAEGGFFPFELPGEIAAHTALYNRSQVVAVTLLEDTIESQLDRDTPWQPNVKCACSSPMGDWWRGVCACIDRPAVIV